MCSNRTAVAPIVSTRAAADAAAEQCIKLRIGMPTEYSDSGVLQYSTVYSIPYTTAVCTTHTAVRNSSLRAQNDTLIAIRYASR